MCFAWINDVHLRYFRGPCRILRRCLGGPRKVFFQGHSMCRSFSTQFVSVNMVGHLMCKIRNFFTNIIIVFKKNIFLLYYRVYGFKLSHCIARISGISHEINNFVKDCCSISKKIGPGFDLVFVYLSTDSRSFRFIIGIKIAKI